MSKPKAAVLTFGAICVSAVLLIGGLGQVRQAMAQTVAYQVTSRERTLAGKAEGEVLIGDSVVTRIRSSAGGMTAPQRAVAVAHRLDKALSDGNPVPADMRVARLNGEYVVMAGDQLVITADSYHAAQNHTTPKQLATIWRNNLTQAVSSRVASYRAEQARPISRICPIVSVGSGVRVGVANVTGPASAVHQAAFVGQLETTFQKVVRIRIFVPIKAKNGVDRVPQVNVNAYGDMKL